MHSIACHKSSLFDQGREDKFIKTEAEKTGETSEKFQTQSGVTSIKSKVKLQKAYLKVL